MTDKQPGRAYEHVQRKLTEQERNALRDSLQAHGLRDPITLDQHDDILDGYNREDLCRELGIKRQYRTLEVDDAVHWIKHNQTARRNLTEQEMREMIIEMKATDPAISTRTIAEKLGVSQTMVAKNLRKSGEFANSAVKGKDGKTYKPKPKLTPKKVQTYATMKAAAAHGATIDQLATRHNVSPDHVKEVLDTPLPPSDEELAAQPISASAQEKLDAKWRALQKTFDHTVETKVIDEIKKRLEELYIPEYMKLLREVKKMLEWRRGVMKRVEYNRIIRCLHPDTGGHASDEARNEAFRLFTMHEARLVDDDQEARLKRVSELPDTVEEMMARRRTKAKA